MKRIVGMLFLFVIAVSVIAEKGNSIGKVTFPIGKTYIQSKGSVKWNKVRYYMPVYERDKIKTGKNARCEVTLQTKKVMRIGENSVSEVTMGKDGAHEVKISRGLAWLSIFLPKGKTKLRVRTPSAVCAIRGTVYRLQADSAQTTYRCYKGTIKVTPFKKDGQTPTDSSFAISAGEELVVVSDFEAYKKQQEKEYQDFQKSDEEEFQKFMEQDQKEFNDQVQADLKAFKAMQGIHFKQSKFDQEKDAQSDWVQWNKERDKLLNE